MMSTFKRRQFLRNSISVALGLTGVTALSSCSRRDDNVDNPSASAELVITRGAFVKEFPLIEEQVTQPEVRDFLLALDEEMFPLSRMTPKEPDDFTLPPVPAAEMESLLSPMDEVLNDLFETFDPNGEQGDEVRLEIKERINQLVKQTLAGDSDHMTTTRDLYVPYNMEVVPKLNVVGTSLSMMIASTGSMLMMPNTMLNSVGDILATKEVIIVSLIISVIGFILALMNIKMPKVDPMKIAPKIRATMRTQAFKRALQALLAVFRNPNATAGQKFEAVKKLLKILKDAGVLKSALKEILTSFGFVDLMMVIGGFILIILSSGAAVVARLAIAIGGLALALANFAINYKKSQQNSKVAQTYPLPEDG